MDIGESRSFWHQEPIAPTKSDNIYPIIYIGFPGLTSLAFKDRPKDGLSFRYAGIPPSPFPFSL